MSEELTSETPSDFTDLLEAGAEEWQRMQTEAALRKEDLQDLQKEEEQVTPQPQQEKDPGFIADNPVQAVQEVGAAVVGGGADAVESVGGFAELTGDTLKTGISKIFGGYDETQDPFSEHYVHGDGNWLDIPDHLVPENKTGMGKLARGLVEFGLLTAATGGVGGAAGGGIRVGTRAAALARSAGMGAKGVRTIKFLHKGAVIASEGAIADLISNSSESANIANLVNEHAPWIPFSEALSVQPEDNAWIARIKTVAAGSGINLVGAGLTGYIKGAWSAGRARQAGKSVDEANAIGNQVMDDEIARSAQLDENAATEMAATNFVEGRGVSHALPRDEYLRSYLDEAEYARYVDPDTSLDDVAALDEIANTRGSEAGDVWNDLKGKSDVQAQDYLDRTPDPFVNSSAFNDSERATYRPDSEKPLIQNVRESISDIRQGGEGRSYEPLFTESALKKMSRGNANLEQYIIEAGEDLAREAFKSLDNQLNYKEVQDLILKQSAEMHAMLEAGGEEATRQLKQYFKKNSPDGIVYRHAGAEVVTGTATQKGALQIVINTLAKQVEAISTGAVDLADNGLPIGRQVEQVFDQLKIALTEHKKSSYMAGSELAAHKGFVLGDARRKQINRDLSQIDTEMDEYFGALNQLNKKGNLSELRDLMEMHRLSGGKVRTLDHIHTYLKKVLKGGRMDGEWITGRWRTELRSVFYNSILSSLKTPIKAIAGTNLIGILRPFQAYLGAGLSGDKVEMMMAAAQIDSLGKAFAEGFEMFKHNWDLGVNRKAQSYVGKFDFEKDIDNWKGLGEYYNRYADPVEQKAYGAIDTIVDLNNNPWMRYSQNGMGAGDALARTIIGRYEMRQRAARAALESGIDIDNVRGWADKNEQLFRQDIFKKDEYGKWVVSDKAASLAGDEAAMTKALEGNLAGFERIAKLMGLRAFFPFVRTGFNALNLTFQHTPLVKFQGKYQDIMEGVNLNKYGIRPEDLPQAQALMRGRIATGNAIVGMSVVAGLAGNMTGDYPMDKETRDLWKANGIQPYSFKIGNTYISYKDIEPFNTIFSATANVVAYSHVLGEDMTDHMLSKLVWMASAVLVDKSMLAGVEDLAAVMNATTAEGKLLRTGSKYVRSHIPYAGLLGQLGSVMDANQKEANTFLEQIIKRDAVLKSILPPKYDILSKDRSGKKYTVGPENPLLRLFNSMSPVAVTFVDEDPVKMALAEISYNLPESLSMYQGEPLNSYERSEMQKYMAMGDLRKRLEKLTNDPTWRKDVDAYKAQGLKQRDGYNLVKQRFYILVDKEFRRAKKEAILQVRRNNPNLASRLDERLYKAKLSKTGTYNKTNVDYLLNQFPR